jgi:hypothetical protein
LLQVTCKYYNTFNMKHQYLSMFDKRGYEGSFHYWRDINVKRQTSI